MRAYGRLAPALSPRTVSMTNGGTIRFFFWPAIYRRSLPLFPWLPLLVTIASRHFALAASKRYGRRGALFDDSC